MTSRTAPRRRYMVLKIILAAEFVTSVVVAPLGDQLEAFVEEAIPADSLETLHEECSAPCPRGELPTPRRPIRQHRPTSNGCGPQSGTSTQPGDGRYQVKEPYGLIECCNSHDVCYQTCGLTFDDCELMFSECLTQVCSVAAPIDVPGCKKQAEAFSRMTRRYGCSFHRASVVGDEKWDSHCDCRKLSDVPSKVEAAIKEFLAEYAVEDAVLWAKVQEVLARIPDVTSGDMIKDWAREAGWLWYDMTVAYDKEYVQFVEAMRGEECVLWPHRAHTNHDLHYKDL